MPFPQMGGLLASKQVDAVYAWPPLQQSKVPLPIAGLVRRDQCCALDDLSRHRGSAGRRSACTKSNYEEKVLRYVSLVTLHRH